ncbi:RRQRL motif-containing zinc-binding protein [Amycolatopsis acididurans]|uniref:RRQRL motif-containing zinc-binding protein n=1 Tax=Amycolatopsis acididurans TaxID=2724524 RepID=UPI001FE4F897|nr:RRQRL motif-containing zinc-binding protein [Amycolatopsis acididurans]
MSGRQYPWDLRPVPWSERPEFTRGLLDGVTLLSYGIAPRDKLATRRQLRTMGLRPGGQSPAAVMYFRCRKAANKVYANLYLVAEAKPVRPMTPARRAALEKAMTARRTCRECGETGYAELPKAHRTCEPCRYRLGMLAANDYLHDYLTGTPVATETDVLPRNVIPLRPAPSRVEGARHSWKGVA